MFDYQFFNIYSILFKVKPKFSRIFFSNFKPEEKRLLLKSVGKLDVADSDFDGNAFALELSDLAPNLTRYFKEFKFYYFKIFKIKINLHILQLLIYIRLRK